MAHASLRPRGVVRCPYRAQGYWSPDGRQLRVPPRQRMPEAYPPKWVHGIGLTSTSTGEPSRVKIRGTLKPGNWGPSKPKPKATARRAHKAARELTKAED